MSLGQLFQVMAVSVLLTFLIILAFGPWIKPALRYLVMLCLGQKLTFKGTRYREPRCSEVNDER